MPTRRVTDTAGQIEQEVVGDAAIYTDADGKPVREPLAPEPIELPGATAAKAAETMTALANAASEPASDDGTGFSAEQTAALQRLRRLGRRRAVVRAELEKLEEELLGEAILEAFKLGIPKRVIAKESQVVRQTVYNVIERTAAS